MFESCLGGVKAVSVEYKPGGGGGGGGTDGTPLYGLYRYMRPQRGMVSQPFWS